MIKVQQGKPWRNYRVLSTRQKMEMDNTHTHTHTCVCVVCVCLHGETKRQECIDMDRVDHVVRGARESVRESVRERDRDRDRDRERESDMQQSNETGGITNIVVRDIFDSAVGAHVAEVRGTLERDRDHQPNFACTAFLAVDIGTLPLVHHAQQRHSYVASHMRRRIHACHMRRRIHASRTAAALLYTLTHVAVS